MKVAIVGAGPAGAHLAFLLRTRGAEVQLFDARTAWEKPCGGGVTSKALREFDFLAAPDTQKQMVSSLRLMTAQARELTVKPSQSFAIYSRAEMSRLMRQRAVDAGVQLFCERVEKTDFIDGKWQIQTSGQKLTVDFLVGADGANSIIRRRVGIKFTEQDFAYALGWRTKLQPNQIVSHVDIQYLGDISGYIWMFPRTDQLSYGIATGYRAATPAQLKARLLAFIRTQDAATANEIAASTTASTQNADFYGAMIPALGVARWDTLKVADETKNWALIGDAAGFVDPITGEGIYYALKSAELLAQALLTNITSYDARWRDEFGSELRRAAELEERFYFGKFAGQPMIERMVQIARQHRGVRAVLRDLVAGDQGYVTLKQRLLKTAWQVF